MSDGTLTAERRAVRPPLHRLLSDARLVKLARDGSTAAFAAIYGRHHQSVYRYCRSILRNDDDARDALQNTMLKAMQALSGESREIALRPWLFRIAHNESIGLLRRRPRETTLDGADELAALEADPATRERLRALIADLDQLAPRQRSALVMRELNGLEFTEIALALESSPEAAKQAVYEARCALHELEEGREMGCEEVRRQISVDDRRLLRARRVRGHLRACSDCAAFAKSTRSRSGQLAALAPPLPAPAALAVLEGILGGGTGGGGLAALTGAGSGAAAGLGGSTAVKLGVAGILALGAGVATLEHANEDRATADARPPASSPGAAAGSDSSASSDRGPQRTAGKPHGERRSAGRGAGASAGGPDSGGGGRGGSQPPGGVAGEVTESPPEPGLDQGPGSGAASPPAPAAPPSSGTGTGVPTPKPPRPPQPPRAGGGPLGVPPGHGGIPPGLGGTPPGLGAPPPGHGGPLPGGSWRPASEAGRPGAAEPARR